LGNKWTQRKVVKIGSVMYNLIYIKRTLGDLLGITQTECPGWA
jgi:hypothetical protein